MHVYVGMCIVCFPCDKVLCKGDKYSNHLKYTKFCSMTNKMSNLYLACKTFYLLVMLFSIMISSQSKIFTYLFNLIRHWYVLVNLENCICFRFKKTVPEGTHELPGSIGKYGGTAMSAP